MIILMHREKRYFGFQRQKTLGESILNNAMNHNRMQDFIQAPNFRMNMDWPQNLK